jgi:hypothetical protein
VEEVVELLRYARSLDLIPMLMTHGDSFRRRRGSSSRLMVEGGLTEVSIHVDTTQRGRRASGGARAHRGRAQPAARGVRGDGARGAAATGLPLRAATTMTVTRDNLDGVADVVRWLAGHADAFRLISFQPIAQVGRTEAGYGGGVSVEALWDRVAEGLGVPGGAARMAAHGRVVRPRGVQPHGQRRGGARPGEAAALPRHPRRRRPHRRARGRRLPPRFGGVSFRLDGRARAAARFVGLAAAAPRFVLGNLLPYAGHWLRAWAAAAPGAGCGGSRRGRRR